MDTAGAIKESVVVLVPPFTEAEIVTVSLEETEATEAANCALLCPARIVAEPGTTTFALLLDSVTVAFTAAVDDKVKVQVEVPTPVKLFAEQESELSTLDAGAAKPTCADRRMPLSVAVTVAVWPDAITPAVTANEPLLAPLPMATEAGVDKTSLSSLKEMVTPPAEGLDKLTVQVAV